MSRPCAPRRQSTPLPGKDPSSEMEMSASKALQEMQEAYLNRLVPAHHIRQVSWSGGSTQVIEAGAGPALLLIHGGLGEAFQWAPLIPLLSRNHRVLAVDRP